MEHKLHNLYYSPKQTIMHRKRRGCCEYLGCRCPLFHGRRTASIGQCAACTHGAIWHRWDPVLPSITKTARVPISNQPRLPPLDMGASENRLQSMESIPLGSGASRMEDFKERLTCIICMEHPCNCLLGCGHAAFCMTCVEKVTQCPLCRKKVLGKTQFIPL